MKILIIKPSSLGDIIHALPFLKAMRDSFPSALIDWVVSRNLQGILEKNPFINKVIIIDKDSWKRPFMLPETIKDIFGLVKTLRSEQYDMVVDLQGLLRSGLMTFFSSSPLKAGFKEAREGSRFFYNKKISVNGTIHAVDRCLRIAQALGARTAKIDFPLFIDNSAREKVKNLTGNIHDYLVIVPSASWESKRWPAGHFGRLISSLPLPCIITGSNADKEVAQNVLASSGGKGINLSGKTNLQELTALIAGAKAVVSNDSGPLHIATALGIPVIALFGPTDPRKTGPYGWSENRPGERKDNIRVVKLNTPCSPCFKKKCRDPFCMSNITVETVLDAVKEFL
jgi:heptosyltransferase-1